jgi:AMP-polyphosphate phosphotransferase
MLDKIDLSKKVDKKTFKEMMPSLEDQLYQVQKASWDAGIPVIILFEGWDAAGKGTSIQKLTSPIDPRGFKLYAIRAPRTFENKNPWLWRFWLKVPPRGEWAIFDRSWYGRVMVERVESLIPEGEWRRAYRDITEFERTLTDDGTQIIKFFLHISKQEQKRRFEKLAKDPLNAWHVTPEDWEHHRRYDDWLLAYEEAFERTETEWGPWTIVEATDRRHTWVKIYQTVIQTLAERMGLSLAPVTAASDDHDEDAEQHAGTGQVEEGELKNADQDFELEPSGEDSDDENPLGYELSILDAEEGQSIEFVETATVDEWKIENPT